jgi:TP901 family phage tail tape measure protein
MSNEVQLEISQNTAAMQSMAEAIDKVAASTAKLSRQQGTLKTTGKESLDALRAMQAGITDFGSGLKGLQDAMKSMQTGLTSAMQELAATISTGFAGLAPKALQAGEDTTKNLAAGIGKGKGLVAQEVKKLQLEYEAAIRSGGSFTAEGLGFLKTRGVSLVPDDRAALVNTALAIKGRKEAADREAEIDKAYAQYNKQRSAVSMEALKAQEIAQAARIKSAQAADDAELLRVKRAGATYLAELKALDAQVASVMKKQMQPGNASSAYASAQVFAKQTANTPVYSRASLFGGGTLQALPVEHANLAKAVTGSTKALADNAAGMKIWTGHANDAHSAARGLASGFGAMWLTWGNIIPLLAGAAVSHTIAGVVKQGAEVNHIMETMRVLAEQTAQETAKLNEQLMTMATTGPIGPKALAEGMKQLALAGLKPGEVGSALKDAVNLSIAGDVDMKKAADSLTGLGAAFNIDARGYNYIADVVAKTAAVSKASVESIADAMKAASVVHKQYGVSLEDTALGVALLNNLNIQGTAAGTALRNMYVDLSGRTSSVRMHMKELGLEVQDGKGKFLDFVTVVERLNEKLSERTPAAQAAFKQRMLSERGGKPIIEALELSNQKGTEVDPFTGEARYKNKLVELKAMALDFDGFAIRSAATLAMTAQNQMNSVVSSYQAALQSAFTTAEPYINSVSMSLRNLFNSNEFKEGLSSLIYGVGEGIKFFIRYGDVIVDVIKVLAAYKIGQLAANLATVASNAAMEKASVTMLATSASAKVAAIGLTGVATAMSVVSTTALAGIGRLLGILNPFIAIAATAYTAWQLFGSSRDAAMDEAKTTSAIANLDAYNNKLDEEYKRLEASNRAYANRLTLQQQLEQDEKARVSGISSSSIAEMENKIKAKKEEMSGLGRTTSGYAKAKFELEDLQVAKSQLELARIDATLKEQKVTEAARLAKERTKKEQAERTAQFAGALGGPIEGSPSNLATYEATHLSAYIKVLDAELSVLHDKNAKEATALADKHRNHLMTDAQFYVAKSMQDEAAYVSESKAIKDRYDLEYAAATDAQQRILKKLGVVGIIGKGHYDTETASLKFLAMGSDQFNASYTDQHERARAKSLVSELESLNELKKGFGPKRDEAAGKLESANTLRQEQANNALAGSYRNIEMSVEALDKQMVGHHAQIMGQQADALVSHPFEQPWEKAGREQHKASLKKYADDIARIQEDINKSRKQSLDNLGAAWDSGNMDEFLKALDANLAAEQKLAVAQGRLDASRVKSGVLAGQDAEEAKKTAFKNEVTAFQKDLSTGVSGAISTAVFDGGAQGGEQLRKYLEQMFIRKPFEIVVQMGMEKLMAGAGESAIGGLFNWAKGGFGTLKEAGGVKSSTTVDEFGQIVESQQGFMSGIVTSLSSLFATTTPTATTAATTNMTAATTMMSAATTIAAAASAMAAGAGASGLGGLAKGGGLLSGGGAADYNFVNEGGFADVGVGFASGGQANPFSIHPVNENGTELLSMAGKDYLMTGSQGATVTSVRDMPSGGSTIQHNVTINVDSRADQAQVHALVMGAVRQGNAQLVDQLQQSGALSR